MKLIYGVWSLYFVTPSTGLYDLHILTHFFTLNFPCQAYYFCVYPACILGGRTAEKNAIILAKPHTCPVIISLNTLSAIKASVILCIARQMLPPTFHHHHSGPRANCTAVQHSAFLTSSV